jgi:hypothetical protein
MHPSYWAFSKKNGPACRKTRERNRNSQTIRPLKHQFSGSHSSPAYLARGEMSLSDAAFRLPISIKVDAIVKPAFPA